MRSVLVKISCFALLSPILVSAQDAIPTDKPSSDLTFVKTEKITKFYSKDELNKMPKLDLLNIYKSRLEYLIEVLPFISLHPAPGSSFHDMSIPETEANKAHLEKETKNKEDFIKSLNETLDDVIPYSEKIHIIWAILYFDEMIKKSDYLNKK